ncbi:MAG: Crp/Fnr family transcriptional regulator [Bradymonadaceae bacterium]
MTDVSTDIEELLRQFIVFEDLEIGEYDSIASAIERHPVEAGEDLITAGEVSRELFGLIDGRVEVIKRGDDQVWRLAVLEPYAVLGELGFVLGEPRTATVRAVDELEVWRLNGEMFDELADAHVEAARAIEDNIIRMMAQRQVQTNREMLELMRRADEDAEEYHTDEESDFGEQLMRRWTV